MGQTAFNHRPILEGRHRPAASLGNQENAKLKIVKNTSGGYQELPDSFPLIPLATLPCKRLLGKRMTKCAISAAIPAMTVHGRGAGAPLGLAYEGPRMQPCAPHRPSIDTPPWCGFRRGSKSLERRHSRSQTGPTREPQGGGSLRAADDAFGSPCALRFRQTM
jgi:hypothetical protein